MKKILKFFNNAYLFRSLYSTDTDKEAGKELVKFVEEAEELDQTATPSR